MKLIPKQDYVLYYLLAAWRGKLSDKEWETRIRKVLPRGVNGDVYDLADCLLKQALVGPVPNQLFISYLKHAVNCELVSHSAVLSSISNQAINIRPNNNGNNSIGRTWPLICLLDFLKSFRDKISCKGTELECLNLCLSISQLIYWLLKSIYSSIDYTIGGASSSSSITTSTSIPSSTPTTTPSNNNNANTTTTATSSITLPGNNGGCGPNNSSTSSNQSTNMININSSANNLTGATQNISGFNSSNAQSLNCNDSIIKIIDLCTEMIQYFTERPFTKSLLFISKLEYKQDFEQILNIIRMIQQKLNDFPALNSLQDRIPNFKLLYELDLTFSSPKSHPAMVAAQQLRCIQMHRIRSTQIVVTNHHSDKRMQLMDTPLIRDSTINYALFNSLYPLVAFDVTLRPARSHKHLARQIATITNLHSAPISVTYCELIRASMIGLIDTDGTPAKVKWAFFTFLKLPKLLLELSNVHKAQQYPSNAPSQLLPQKSSHLQQQDINSAPQNNENFISDLKLAFERLCEYSPLLDEAEYKCNCDLFKCLVKELIKNDPSLIQLKSVDLRKFSARRTVALNNDDTASGYMMLKAEPVVTSMLATFDSEQDPAAMYSLLTGLVSGKHFEFTLSAAASTGRLDMFIRKLVEHNELNRQPRINATNDLQTTSALIFDITFLMLTYIAQQYGPTVIAHDQSSTFSKWFYDCYNPSTRINCPKVMLRNCNEEIVTSLIKQLIHPQNDIQVQSVNWQDVCTNIPKAMSEIINAWTQGVIGEDTIKLVIDKIKSRMCSLAVITATWLQSYIKTLNDVDAAKPLSLLQNLTKANSKQQQQKQSGESTTTTTAAGCLKSESYTERSSLMCSIIRKIYFELVPKTNQSPSATSQQTSSGTNNANSCSSTAKNSASSVSAGTSANQTGSDPSDDSSLDETSSKSVNDRFISILSTQEIFLANVKHCLNRGWIDQKSLNSLNSLFKMIGSDCFTNLIIDQILTSHESPSDLSRAVNITFGLFHLDIESCALTLLRDTVPRWLMNERKQILLNQPRAFALANLTVMTISEVFTNLKVERLSTLNGCLANLMKLFKDIMSDPIMSQRTLFPVLFLQQTVVCAGENSDIITVHLQPEILLDIINLFSSELTFELVLAMSNLTTTNSRKYAAKAMCNLNQVKESRSRSHQASGHDNPMTGLSSNAARY